MLYIVPEDSSSGLVFWRQFNKLILNGKAEIIDGKGTGGIDTIYPRVARLKLTENDIVFVAIDYSDFGAIRYIELLKSDCKKRGYTLHYTVYSCIEEVFLSFDRLIDWCQIDLAENIHTMYKEMKLQIDEGAFRFDKRSKTKRILEFEYLIKQTLNNKAQFYAAFLSYITNPMNGVKREYKPRFLINKGKLSECWFNNCPSLGRMCEVAKCKLAQDGYTGRDKLTILDKESILSRTGKQSLLYLQKYI